MSFEQLISSASLGDGSKPKYQSIAEDLAQAILNGQVPMGEKLPPQRNLARRLGVTTGTISRAYAILERQGLATARVGDGTYVRSAEHVAQGTDAGNYSPLIDLAHNVAMVGDEAQALQAAFGALGQDPEMMRQVLMYQSETGMRRHREAGAKWLCRFGTTGQWNRVMVTHGAQHGLACVLRSVARPGDALFLTKPLGTGLVLQAQRDGTAPPGALDAAVAAMRTLNRDAAAALRPFGPNAVTDVTGFGLLGHAYEMAKNGDK